MILQSLYELYDRLKEDPAYAIASQGYSPQKITFKVVIKPNGELFEIQDARTVEGGKPVPQQLTVPGGDKKTGEVTDSSVHDKVNLLRNDMPFLLGCRVEEIKDEETGAKVSQIALALLEFGAFRDYHLRIEKAVDDDSFSAVCRFLEAWDPNEALGRNDLTDYGKSQGVFQIVGRKEYIHERPRVRYWYDAQRSTANTSSEKSRCLITGKLAQIARLHEPKIKRVALSSGAPLVSFDKASNAFCSYGGDRQQGLNAPVSQEAAFKYATALNALLVGPRSRKHSLTLGETTVVFWTGKRKSDVEDLFARFAAFGETVTDKEAQDEGLLEKIEIFTRALRKGKEAFCEVDEDADRMEFFLLGLTGQAKGRIGVRFFHRSTVSELLEKLGLHHDHLHIEPQFSIGTRSPKLEFLPIQHLLDETCPRKKGKGPDREKIPPILSGPLLRSIVTGAPYPDGLYSAVIRRIHADRNINYARASVIKGYLVRNKKQEVSMSLDSARTDAAYRLGRLFAVLEKTQTDVSKDLNATIRDRFYSAASASPRSVFPRLLRTYQHHLAKLDGGLKVNREKLVQEIISALIEFPTHLNLADQGVFAIGYYHQNKALWTKKEDKQAEEA